MTLEIQTFPFNLVTPYLRAKWGAYECEVCKTMNWTTMRVDAFPMAGLVAVTTEGENKGPFWSVMPVLCNTCGNTKLLSIDFVNDWLGTAEGKALAAEEERQSREANHGFE